MFNDLNQANNQSRPAVDDIFAETDQSGQSAASTPPANGIETHRIGLAAGAGEDQPVEKGGAPWFKIAVIAIVVIILALAGYLVYSRYFQAPEEPAQPVAGNQIPAVSDQVATSTATTTPEDPAVSEETATQTPEIIPLIPGVNAPGEEAPTTTVEEIVPAAPLDTDQDGLTDEEEDAYGTNINIVDTDVDGLSDYEEVKIYGTNPVVADSDGDTYPDGSEVLNGYNPLGAGKLAQ